MINGLRGRQFPHRLDMWSLRFALLFSWMCGRCRHVVVGCSVSLWLGGGSLWAQEKPTSPTAQIEQLTNLGSDETIASLREIVHEEDESTYANAIDGLVRIAERRYLMGDKQQAKDVANDIWLSSAPLPVRAAAWKLIYLIEHDPSMAASEHTVRLVAHGGRDHARFANWLRTTFVAPHDWVLSASATYELIEGPAKRASQPTARRLDERVRIQFGLRSKTDEAQLLDLLRRTRSHYSTANWQIETWHKL